MSNNKYVAIDLGSSRISAMAAEVQPDGRILIHAIESKPADDVKHGIIEQVSGAAYKVSELIKLLQNSSKFQEIDQVAVSIGAKSMKHIQVSVTKFVGAQKIVTEQLLEDMKAECVRKVQGQNISIYDTIPVSYELDGKKWNNPVDKTGTQITGRYTVIYGSDKIALELERCFDRTGIKLEHMPIASECLSSAVLEEQDVMEGCALINFGAATTTLSIYRDGALQQLLVVPLGGKNITKDIQELGISEQHAEKLKCLKGTAMESLVDEPVYIQVPSVSPEMPPVKISTQFLATIIEARLEEILQPIFEIINDYKQSLGGGIVITGGASKLNHLIDFITENTDIYTRFGNHSEWLADRSPEEFYDPALSQLIGTIAILHEYRLEHPIEEPKKEKKQKLPKGKGIKDKIANGFFKFFEDENNMRL